MGNPTVTISMGAGIVDWFEFQSSFTYNDRPAIREAMKAAPKVGRSWKVTISCEDAESMWRFVLSCIGARREGMGTLRPLLPRIEKALVTAGYWRQGEGALRVEEDRVDFYNAMARLTGGTELPLPKEEDYLT